jgi:hypothetical protein
MAVGESATHLGADLRRRAGTAFRANKQAHHGQLENGTVHDVDIDPHRSAWDNCQLERATLTVDQVCLVAVDHDPAAGCCTWPAPLAMLPRRARP